MRSSTFDQIDEKIDYKLNFDEHVKTLCSKANNKLRELERVTPYMSVEKKKMMINSFFNAQFTASVHGRYTDVGIIVS